MALLPPGVYADFPPADKLTPLFRQYQEVKAQQPGALLLYRLGDFYEMFGHDAVRASGLLGLTLTARQAHKDYKVAMCGVPHHSSVRYIRRLVEAGETVAICEQIEDPSQAKGLVERAVTRVITAGTLVEDEYLVADSSNFLCVVALGPATAGHGPQQAGLAMLESSGGRVELSDVDLQQDSNRSNDLWRDELARLILRRMPAEILVPRQLMDDAGFIQAILTTSGLYRPVLHAYSLSVSMSSATKSVQEYFHVPDLRPLGLVNERPTILALHQLLLYLRETFRTGNLRLFPQYVASQGKLQMEAATLTHLEILPARGNAQTGGPSLFAVLNRCSTAPGRRLLKSWLAEPIADGAILQRRQQTVELLFHEKEFCNQLVGLLSDVADLERILQRIALRRSNPRELRALAASLPGLEQLAILLENAPPTLLASLAAQLAGFAGLDLSLNQLLADEPPVRPGQGESIRLGADIALDELRALHQGGTDWFTQYETTLRQQTGIRSLKVKQTGPFGWFIEVGKAQHELVPAGWERRQTLVSSERYTTPDLRQREGEMGSAGARLDARERELLEELYAQVDAAAAQLVRAAWAAAELDVLCGLATIARERGWCKTELVAAGGATDDAAARRIELESARHPLVEAALGEQYYMPNGCYLDQESQQMMLLTGPNMGGKSSYLRMVATLIVINQLVGYVPAKQARLPLFDRIFTRIGAQDALSRGQSTFMVEMLETAQILRQCTPASLIVLDEVGRGTSTYDGISIAKAVLEHLHEHPARPLTLFATHFFELTDLAALLPRLANFQVEVARNGRGGSVTRPLENSSVDAGGSQTRPYDSAGGLIFTYRVLPGAASDSYGIEVARQAGLPDSVVARAERILAELEDARREALARARQAVQLGLFSSGGG